MDKELTNLQNEFNQIPTSFTSKDKQAVRDKIEKLQNKGRPTGLHIYPKLLTGVVLALAVLIFVVTVKQFPGQFSSNDSAGFEQELAKDFHTSIAEGESEDSDMANSMFDGSTESGADDESLGLNIFNPDTVQDEMILPVINVRQIGDGMIIAFKGDRLTGTLFDEQPLTFSPDADSWKRIPIAEGDIDKDIPIYFDDEEYVRSILGVKGTTNDITITPFVMEYHYSPAGSSITLFVEDYNRIDGEVTNSYFETIALSEELHDIYDDYKISSDDNLLKGLSAFDVFKLYHYANSLNDLNTEYALYYKDESFPYPDKESYITEMKDAQDQTNYTVKQAEEFYEEMLQIQRFDEMKLRDNEVLIRYKTTYEEERHDVGFRLHHDEELGVYKVGWMPIQ